MAWQNRFMQRTWLQCWQGTGRYVYIACLAYKVSRVLEDEKKRGIRGKPTPGYECGSPTSSPTIPLHYHSYWPRDVLPLPVTPWGGYLVGNMTLKGLLWTKVCKVKEGVRSVSKESLFAF
jgi:hypothetical protein